MASWAFRAYEVPVLYSMTFCRGNGDIPVFGKSRFRKRHSGWSRASWLNLRVKTSSRSGLVRGDGEEVRDDGLLGRNSDAVEIANKGFAVG